MDNPIPFELEFPELGRAIENIINHNSIVRRFCFFNNFHAYKLTNGKVVVTFEANRNDPCKCGSGKKVKKCCGVDKRYI
jgi:uncharacterized protein YchJ